MMYPRLFSSGVGPLFGLDLNWKELNHRPQRDWPNSNGEVQKFRDEFDGAGEAGYNEAPKQRGIMRVQGYWLLAIAP